MNNIWNHLKKVFTFRNNILFMLLTLIVSMAISVSVSVNRITVEKEYSDFSSFPENYSYFYSIGTDPEEDMKKKFPGLNYSLLSMTYQNIEISMEISNTKFILVGVDSDFLNYPLPNYNYDLKSNTLEMNTILSGSAFTKDDILAETRTVLMNQCYLDACGYKGEDIYINGVSFKLKGVLSDPSTEKKYADTNILNVPVYIPYTTFNKLLGNSSSQYYTAVVETMGYRFSQFEEDGLLSSKYIHDSEKNEALKELENQTLPILLSLILLSVSATFIIEFIMVRNRHNEIGIKRAIGATKTDIVYEFASDSAIVTLISVVFGCALGILCTSLFNVNYCFVLNAPVLKINFPEILALLSGYYLLMFLAVTGAAAVGANINISSIIVEER